MEDEMDGTELSFPSHLSVGYPKSVDNYVYPNMWVTIVQISSHSADPYFFLNNISWAQTKRTQIPDLNKLLLSIDTEFLWLLLYRFILSKFNWYTMQ